LSDYNSWPSTADIHVCMSLCLRVRGLLNVLLSLRYHSLKALREFILPSTQLSTHHAVLSVLYIAVYDHDVIRSTVYTQSHSTHTRTTALFYIHIIHLLTISMITSDVEILLGVTDRRRTDRTQWDVPYWQMSPAYGTSHVQSNVSRA